MLLICFQTIVGEQHVLRRSYAVSPDFILTLSSEFLIHAADVEGLCQGIDKELVTSRSSIPYALHGLTRRA